MKTTFNNFLTSDSVLLQGLLFQPEETTKAVIHVHGLAGNFYENSFIKVLASRFTKNNIAFFTFNNRGHDYIADIMKKSGDTWSSFQGGGAYEVFTECLEDIHGAIQFLKNKGFNEIYLQGHSSGANKVVYYLSQESSQKIKGTILLSPCDDIGLQIENLGEKYDNMLDIARVLIKEGNENSLMPEGSFYSYPISAKTYLNFFGPNSPIDTFPYRDPTREFKNLQKIETPILALFGNNGEYVIDNIAETLDLLEMKAGSCPSFTKIILDGATHNYLGKENKLADILIDWITKQ